jgi:hypothetical protein
LPFAALVLAHWSVAVFAARLYGIAAHRREFATADVRIKATEKYSSNKFIHHLFVLEKPALCTFPHEKQVVVFDVNRAPSAITASKIFSIYPTL